MKTVNIKESEVIDLLKSGEMITSGSNDFFGSKGQLVYSSRWYRIAQKRIHSSTISAMIRRNVIHGPNDDKSICYTLKKY